MALTRRNPAASFEAPKTEAAAATPATETVAAAPAPAAAAPAPTPAPAPAPAAALVVQVPKSLVVQNMQVGHNFMDSLKDALRVDWDTLNRLKASQGRIAFGDISLGEWIEFSLLSWQDNWLVSPGKDTDEAKALAKYSDDGKTIKDTGEDINDYMQRLKDMDYPDCRLGKRCVLAFELIDCDKDASVDEGMLFQTDLAPTSRAAFERYRIQSALDIGKARATGDDVIRIRATATIKKNGKNEYTQLDFSRAKQLGLTRRGLRAPLSRGESMRYFIGDTETTGLKGRVMEIAFLEIDPVTLEIENSWQSLIDPEIPVEPGAFAIHGISDEMVATEPTIEEFVSVILGGRFEEPCTLIAHNVRFDKPFFEPVMNVTTTYCTLQLVRQMFPTGPVNHKLGTMKEYLELEGGEAHRAMGDVLTVHQMLRKLLPSTGKTLLDHLQVPARTVYTMPFGDHKGKMLMDLPVQYRTWLLSSNIDADLRRSLMKLRETGI